MGEHFRGGHELPRHALPVSHEGGPHLREQLHGFPRQGAVLYEVREPPGAAVEHSGSGQGTFGKTKVIWLFPSSGDVAQRTPTL